MRPADSDNPRQAVMAQTRRILVKVGSRLLTDCSPATPEERIDALIGQLNELRASGCETILVTSGAIGVGMGVLQRRKRPRDLSRSQAMAAIGQSRLMSFYETACQRHGFHCGQMLLSADDLRDRTRHLNICNCLNALLAQKILPIINENDTVTVDEIRFGDNDILAALVATMVRADLTILLTTVNGLRHCVDGTLGERVPIANALTEEMRAMAGGTDGNPFSTGGMTSKLRAAGICMTAGESLWIADGTDFGVLQRMRSGEDVGTLFVPGATRLSGPKRWLAFFTEPGGEVTVDAGAARALRRAGRSLLPSGVVAAQGAFAKGDTVRIMATDGSQVGMGISNYATEDVERIKGLRSDGIAAVLGKQAYDEVIHRDNLVLLDRSLTP